MHVVQDVSCGLMQSPIGGRRIFCDAKMRDEQSASAGPVQQQMRACGWAEPGLHLVLRRGGVLLEGDGVAQTDAAPAGRWKFLFKNDIPPFNSHFILHLKVTASLRWTLQLRLYGFVSFSTLSIPRVDDPRVILKSATLKLANSSGRGKRLSASIWGLKYRRGTGWG